MTQRVLIIGAGIIGASSAFHLAEAGAEVRVLEADRGVGGMATSNSWAWINASWGNPPDYLRLRRDSMQKWRDLDRRVPGLNINWCGGLLWDLPEAELRAYAAARLALGMPMRIVDRAEAAKIEPQLRHPPDLAAHVADEGVVEPVHAVERLFDAAKALGAEVLCNTAVRWLTVEKGRVTGVMTQEGPLETDVIVLTAGTSCKLLLKDVGRMLALDEPPGLLVHSAPAPEMLNGLVMAPELHVRQTAEGRLVAGSDFTGTDPGDNPRKAAEELFAKVQAFVGGGEVLSMERFTVGYRPTPRDGVSAIGAVPGLEGLYLCVTHSGVTLAPALGAYAAAEITGQGRDELLAPFAPDRLLSPA